MDHVRATITGTKMLTQNEKQGFEEILQTFSEDDIIALKDTVTNRLVATRNKRGMNIGDISLFQRFIIPSTPLEGLLFRKPKIRIRIQNLANLMLYSE